MPTPLEKLEEEARVIAAGGNVAPTVGRVTPRNDLPSGWGADESGRIQRYTADGSLNVPTPPAVTTPVINVPNKLSPDEYQAQYGAKPVDEAKIRSEILKQNQERIDAINAIYAQKVSEEREVGRGRLGSTRAIQARSGLIGSDFGAAQTDTTAKYNKGVIDAIEREKMLQIAAVYDKVDALTTEKVKAQKEEALGNANAYKDYLSKSQTEARDYAKTLGAAGLTLDTLKTQNPEALKSILETSGYDEFTLATVLNANKPKAEQIDYEFKTYGNKVIGYGLNKATGQIETVEKDLPVPVDNIQDYNSPTTLPDGTVIFTPKQIDPNRPLNEQVLMYGAEGQFAKETPITKTIGSGKNARLVVSLDNGVTWKDAITGQKAVVPTGSGSGGGGSSTAGASNTATETQAAKDMQAELSQLVGPDGYVSPDTYTQARSAWVQAGYSPTAFDTKMKGYRNPNNQNYVTDKQ